MRVSDKIINSDDLVKELSSGEISHLVKTPLMVLLMTWVFAFYVPNWVSVCMFVIKSQQDSLLFSAQPDFSICVGVFLLVLWKMSYTY